MKRATSSGPARSATGLQTGSDRDSTQRAEGPLVGARRPAGADDGWAYRSSTTERHQPHDPAISAAAPRFTVGGC